MEAFFQTYGWAVVLLISIWTLPWKGVSLWKAAHKNSKAWFVVLLLVNSLAILDILYIYVFSKRGGKGGVEAK